MWIRIRIGSAFAALLNSDPYRACRAGSTGAYFRAKNIRKNGGACRCKKGSLVLVPIYRYWYLILVLRTFLLSEKPIYFIIFQTLPAYFRTDALVRENLQMLPKHSSLILNYISVTGGLLVLTVFIYGTILRMESGNARYRCRYSDAVPVLFFNILPPKAWSKEKGIKPRGWREGGTGQEGIRGYWSCIFKVRKGSLLKNIIWLDLSAGCG